MGWECQGKDEVYLKCIVSHASKCHAVRLGLQSEQGSWQEVELSTRIRKGFRSLEREHKAKTALERPGL